MKCNKCNFEIDTNVNFCSNCGENLKSEPSEISEKIAIKSISNLTNKINNIPHKIKYLPIAIAILLLFFIIGLSLSSSKSVVPFDSSVCLDKDKDIVFEEFQSAGFSNISLEAIEDLDISEENKYNTVACVSINDITDFDENSEFKSSIQIIIKYHTFKSAIVPFSSDEVKGQNIDNILVDLENIGFSKITVEEKYDLDPDNTTVTFENEISIDGTNDFKADSSFPINSEIKIITHKPYNKYSLKVFIDFIPNLMLSTYDISFNVGGHTETLTHGTDGNFEYKLKEGKYTLSFQSEEDHSIKNTVEINLTGNTEASYKINCYNDRINVETKYVENKSAIGKDEAMVPSSAIDCKFENYKDITKLFKKAGFTNISTEILYDIIWGWTKEGEIEKISIDGKTDFQRGEIFDKDAEIVITYHMKKEDNPNKETTTELVAEEYEEEFEEEIENQSILTIQNNTDFSSLMKITDQTDTSTISSFVYTYKGAIIEFDGCIAFMMNHKDYKTRFDVCIAGGNYDADRVYGPLFSFENVNYYDMNVSGTDTVSQGMDFKITAKIVDYSYEGGYILLEPIALEKR